MPKASKKAQTLGQRIREMREKQQIDLSILAEKTGYSPEHLQEIEEGKLAPPVGMLIQISRALQVDSSALLAEEKRKERRQGHLKRTRAYAYKSLTPDAADKHLWAYLVTLEPKKEHEMVVYKHEGEEFMFVLDGKIETQVGDELHPLKKGESLHFNSGITHKVRNLSSKQAKLIVVVYTP